MLENEANFIFEKELSGESLVKTIISDNHVKIYDDKGKQYWFNTIDQTKTYLVKKYEYHRNFQPCYLKIYKIKEI